MKVKEEIEGEVEEDTNQVILEPDALMEEHVVDAERGAKEGIVYNPHGCTSAVTDIYDIITSETL